MAYLGREAAKAPLVSADIPDDSITAAKIVDATIAAGDLAANSVDSSELVDGSIDTSHIGDNQVTLAKMAGGTDGNIISYDASGDPVAIATGDDGEVLTSAGAGQPPAFEAAAAGGISVWAVVPFVSMTIPNANTDVPLTDQVHQANMPKTGGTDDFVVDESGDYVNVKNAGTYLVTLTCSGMGASASRENFVEAAFTTDGSTPGTGALQTAATITRTTWQNPGSSAQYVHASSSGIFICTGTSTRVKCFARAVYGDQAMAGNTSFLQSGLTFIKIG